MIHTNTELQFISEEIGYGVVATEFIPAGTITWVQDRLDRVFSPSEVNSLPKIYQDILDYYTFRNNKGDFILCWDNGRYVNHSFKSNCLTTAYDFEIAIQDIEAGEQLTDDYGYLNIAVPFRGVDEGTKRKVVYPDDLKKYCKVWDKKIAKVFHKIPKVEQALRPLIENSLWQKINLIAEGKQELESILNNYFEQKK